MKKLITALILVMLILETVSCTSTSSEQEDNTSTVAPESWQIGENWQYSQQAIWNDTFVGVEYIFGDGLEGQFISRYNLQTRETERLPEFDPTNEVSVTIEILDEERIKVSLVSGNFPSEAQVVLTLYFGEFGPPNQPQAGLGYTARVYVTADMEE